MVHEVLADVRRIVDDVDPEPPEPVGRSHAGDREEVGVDHARAQDDFIGGDRAIDSVTPVGDAVGPAPGERDGANERAVLDRQVRAALHRDQIADGGVHPAVVGRVGRREGDSGRRRAVDVRVLGEADGEAGLAERVEDRDRRSFGMAPDHHRTCGTVSRRVAQVQIGLGLDEQGQDVTVGPSVVPRGGSAVVRRHSSPVECAVHGTGSTDSLAPRDRDGAVIGKLGHEGPVVGTARQGECAGVAVLQRRRTTVDLSVVGGRLRGRYGPCGSSDSRAASALPDAPEPITATS